MPKLIMVVDDEEDIRTSVRTVLEKEGYKIVTAENVDDCLKKLKSKKFDLILLDVMMPGTPVSEIIDKVKDIKIALFTVVRSTESEKEALLKNKNVVGYIQKPISVTELVSEVKKLTK